VVNFIVTGNCKRVVSAVLLAIRSFTDAGTVVVGGAATGILRWSGLCKRQVTVDIDGGNDQAYIDAVKSIAKENPHVILIPADCDAIRLINRVRGRLGVRTSPIPDLPTLNMFDNKWLFHQFCTEQGLPVPATLFFASKSDLDFARTAGELGLPFVVKPLNCAGSTGVCIIRSEAGFRAAVLDNADYDYGALIAQAYVAGSDVDISFLAIDGRLSAFAIQQARGSQIDFLSLPALQAMATDLAAASFFHGVMHVDARVEEATGKLYLIESNPRFWASLTASVWCGLNFVAESLLPSAKENGVRAMTTGSVSTRHPLIRPAAWRALLFDRSVHGRLLRAMAFDPPALRDFARELPAAVQRVAERRRSVRLDDGSLPDFAKDGA